MNNEGSSHIALEQKKIHNSTRQMTMPSLNETLDVLLAIAEALVQDTLYEQRKHETMLQKRLIELV